MNVVPPQHAILQRDNRTYAITPRIPAGLLHRHHLLAIAAVVEKFHIPIVKITSGQRLALVGIKEEDLTQVYEDLGMSPGTATELCLHYVQACPGTEVCRFGVRDALGLGIRLEGLLESRQLPAKLKVGVSGCQFCCGESLVRDIGLIGKKSGWTVVFGGHSGNRPRTADTVGEDLDDDAAVALVERCLACYVQQARKRERTSRFVERFGVEAFRQIVGAP